MKDSLFFIEHILESIELIKRYTEGRSLEEFLNDVQFQDSVIRRLEIIGEAVKNIPDDIKKEHPEIPWKEIAGMRDIVVHGYFGIDLELTWRTVERDIPELERKISAIYEELKSSE